MSLSYYYEFAAPPKKTAAVLERFLIKAESAARRLGFHPTLILKAAFDTPEQRQFSRRLTGGLYVEAPELKNVLGLSEEDATRYDSQTGSCRLMPRQGVVLVVTNERRHETVFGFFRWPETLRDSHGKLVYNTGLAGKWSFSGYVDSPDPRYREIVRLFADAGYLASETDEFNPCTATA